MRQKREGSVYFRKNHPIWSAFGERAAIVLFIVAVLVLHALATDQSSASLAKQPNPPAAGSAVPTNGFEIFRPVTAYAELKSISGEAVLIERTTMPSIWPLTGRLTDSFGERRNPFRWQSSEFHPGQDIAAPKGTPVSVTADGTVVFAGCKKGYGRIVIVGHANDFSTRYGHLSLIETAVGTLVKRGEEIGLVGSTGRSTGAHLHYEVRVGQQPVDPIDYLPKDKLVNPRLAQCTIHNFL